jgi:hypothetical protein
VGQLGNILLVFSVTERKLYEQQLTLTVLRAALPVHEVVVCHCLTAEVDYVPR